MITIIPVDERSKYKCCVCGEKRSVKYIIATKNKNASYSESSALCNKCALILISNKG